MSRRSIWFLTIAAVLASLTIVVAPAQGTYKGVPGRLAFTVARDDGAHIATARSDDGKGLKVFPKPGSVEAPQFSRDGTKIVYDDYDAEKLFRVNSDGTHRRVIPRPNDTGGYPWGPSFAPNGRRVIYANDGSGSEIWVVNLDGSHNKRLGTVIGEWPRYSPDGSKIVFSDGSDIWIMNANGSDPLNIGGGGTVNEYPDWSPNGNWIGYWRDGAIWKMHPDGTMPTVVSPADADWGPAWSPDGKRLAYPADSDIVVIRADGTGADVFGVDNTNCCIAWQPT